MRVSVAATSTMRAADLGYRTAGLDLLRGVDLDLAAGERVAVIGPNGAGKSSLLRCLYGWWRPTTGVVLLDGNDLAAVKPTVRGRMVGVLVQDAEAGLGLTVADVVRLGRLPHGSGWVGGASGDDDMHVAQALRRLDLTALRDRAFTTLSGGEKQRVLFARALAQQPAILILDEPTNHLDIRHQLELLEVAHGLGIAVVATLHDINLAARWAERLCLLCDGEVRALGTPDAVLTVDLLSAVYGVEVDLDREPRTGAIRLTFHARAPS